MLVIDGSQGEGGGQILRTALALALCQQRPIAITRIRANRRKPGLRRQHLVAVQAAAAIGKAKVAGDTLGSQELRFEPRGVFPGDYRFDIGSAGSTNLVLQTVLPVLMTAAAPSSLSLCGGTHNPLAPTYDFMARTLVPLLNRMGPRISLSLQRHGFFPAGGGLLQCEVEPVAALEPLTLQRRGEVRSLCAEALLANLPEHIAQRELKVLRQALGLSNRQCRICHPESGGPGNALLVTVQSDEVSECFSAIGQLGIRAETLAQRLAQAVREYLQSGVPVGQHLADQLLVPLWLAGEGRFVTQPLSNHTRTNLGVLELFGERVVTVTALSNNQWQIEFQTLRANRGKRSEPDASRPP